MPQVVGLDYYAAQLSLQQAGIYVPVPTYAFLPNQISVTFVKSTPLFGAPTVDSSLTMDSSDTLDSSFFLGPAPPGGTVLAQVPQAGATVAAGAALALTLAEFPMGVAFP